MTYEEAISELVVIKSVYSHMRGEYKPCVEALQMAIDLLRQADAPQTKKTDRIPYDPLVEMDIKRMVEEWLRQTERKNCKLELFDDDGNYIEPQTDCAWK